MNKWIMIRLYISKILVFKYKFASINPHFWRNKQKTIENLKNTYYVSEKLLNEKILLNKY